jgi:ribosomal protein S27AE
MICPKCGDEMNHHADKLVYPAGLEEATRANPALGGVIEEMHHCPGCGASASRRAD